MVVAAKWCGQEYEGKERKYTIRQICFVFALIVSFRLDQSYLFPKKTTTLAISSFLQAKQLLRNKLLNNYDQAVAADLVLALKCMPLAIT